METLRKTIANYPDLTTIETTSGCMVAGFKTWQEVIDFCNDEQFMPKEGIFALFGFSLASPVLLHKNEYLTKWREELWEPRKPMIKDGKECLYHKNDDGEWMIAVKVSD